MSRFRFDSRISLCFGPELVAFNMAAKAPEVTCAGTKTSKVPTRVKLLPYFYFVTSCTNYEINESISACHCVYATNQITSRFGFRQGLRQRSVSREALGPRKRSAPLAGEQVAICRR